VNPARSTATALFVGGWALQQLWLFWLAPLVGAAAAGILHKSLLESPRPEPPVTGRVRSADVPVHPLGPAAVGAGVASAPTRPESVRR
jgi:hypothetical protein